MSKKHKRNKLLRTIIFILLILVSIFATINLLTHDYVRDVIIKGQEVK